MFSLLKHVRNLAIFMYRFQINVYCTSVEKMRGFSAFSPFFKITL